jgi:hypothetical protein
MGVFYTFFPRIPEVDFYGNYSGMKDNSNEEAIRKFKKELMSSIPGNVGYHSKRHNYLLY